MKATTLAARLVFAASLAVSSLNLFAADPASPRERLSLDFGWKFHLGHQRRGEFWEQKHCRRAVDATQFEGWFYEGAGIYRHVWLDKTAPVAIAPDGIFVYSQFKNNVPEGKVEIHVETRLLNSETNRGRDGELRNHRSGRQIAENSRSQPP
jgi:hypothetical protein